MRRVLFALAAVAAVAACGLAAAYVLRPARLAGALRVAALRASGARRARVGGLAAWERDLCRPGEPCRCVALLHGLGDSAITWEAVLAGRKGAPAPPAGSLLLALELPGNEGSAPPADPSGYAVPATARAIRAALETRCSTWTVAGNSFGGWVAGRLAADWPEGVARLVLVNPGGLSDPASERVARFLAAPDVEGMKDFSRRAYHRTPEVPERAWPEVIAGILARPTKATVAAMRREHALDRDARKIRAETVIVWGESDRAIPRSVGERFVRLIPRARLVTVPECGHLPQRECPAAVSAALFNSRIGP